MSEAPRLPYHVSELHLKEFTTWIIENDSTPRELLSQYEVIRYMWRGYVQIIYKNEKGRLRFTGHTTEHYLKFLDEFGNMPGRKGRIKASRRPAKRERLRERDGDNCWLCSATMKFQCEPTDPRAATIEHLLSKSQSGCNHDSNLVLCCLECNQKLGDLPLVEKIKLRDQARSNFPPATLRIL